MISPTLIWFCTTGLSGMTENPYAVVCAKLLHRVDKLNSFFCMFLSIYATPSKNDFWRSPGAFPLVLRKQRQNEQATLNFLCLVRPSYVIEKFLQTQQKNRKPNNRAQVTQAPANECVCKAIKQRPVRLPAISIQAFSVAKNRKTPNVTKEKKQKMY